MLIQQRKHFDLDLFSHVDRYQFGFGLLCLTATHVITVAPIRTAISALGLTMVTASLDPIRERVAQKAKETIIKVQNVMFAAVVALMGYSFYVLATKG